MKIALCQTTVHKDWHKNLRNAERVIADAVKTKADMVVLPEMFICPYNKKAISAAAQPEGGEQFAAGLPPLLFFPADIFSLTDDPVCQSLQFAQETAHLPGKGAVVQLRGYDCLFLEFWKQA